MLDLFRMFPTRVFIQPLLVGSLLFIMQVGYFTWSALSACDAPPGLGEADCMWHIMKRSPKFSRWQPCTQL